LIALRRPPKVKVAPVPKVRVALFVAEITLRLVAPKESPKADVASFVAVIILRLIALREPPKVKVASFVAAITLHLIAPREVSKGRVAAKDKARATTSAAMVQEMLESATISRPWGRAGSGTLAVTHTIASCLKLLITFIAG